MAEGAYALPRVPHPFLGPVETAREQSILVRLWSPSHSSRSCLDT